MQRLARKLEALRLRPSDATVVLVIEANPDITQSEIGRLLDIASANMVPLMRRLEEQELVERTAVDGRTRALRLTAAGRRMSDRVRKVCKAYEDELLRKVPVSDRAAFMRTLRALQEDEADS